MSGYQEAKEPMFFPKVREVRLKLTTSRSLLRHDVMKEEEMRLLMFPFDSR